MDQTPSLPPEVGEGIDQFLQQTRQAFGGDLVSAVLFGSAAEGRLRSTSDVNLLLVLKRFDRSRADKIRDPLRAAHAAMRLDVMFLLEPEIGQAMDAFAVKFADILSRRRVLMGPDPFENLQISREAMLKQTLQVLLNLMLRMRERYALVSLREEQLALVITDMIGPLRACAASLLKLEARPATSPKEALAIILSEQLGPTGADIVSLIDQARSQGSLPPGASGTLLFSLLNAAEQMQQRATGLLKGSRG
ncbi:MAG: nucleotidyltransferase domain-containing protein [Nitrospirae bacterium]|nr:MAG: nucleotidyltransferase domain-containing protein [Nitrospirota bacterium]